VRARVSNCVRVNQVPVRVASAKDVRAGQMTCACHGSQFEVTSGAVLRGPAQRAVRSRAVHVEGDDLLVDE